MHHACGDEPGGDLTRLLGGHVARFVSPNKYDEVVIMAGVEMPQK